MIKKAVLFLILSVLTLNLLFAVDIELEKSSYYPGETLQAKISGYFPENLNINNIGIYSGNAVHQTPSSESKIIKYNNDYFYYAVLPETIGNYSLKIENAKYFENNIQKEDTIIKNFTIKDTNESYLSFTPGFIYTQTDFELNLKAYNKNKEINIEFSPANFQESLNLGYGMEKTVYISVDSIKNFTDSFIKIDNYKIRTIISPSIPINLTTNNTPENESLKDLLAVDPSKIEGMIMKGTDYPFEFMLINKISKSYKVNIYSPNEEIIFSAENITIDEEYLLNVTINAQESFNGSIIFSSENKSLEVPVNITVTTNQSAVNISTYVSTSCADFNGIKCSSGQTCNGRTTFVSDGECCIGTCSNKGSSSGWIWAVVIIIILLIAGWFIYQKSKNPLFQEKMQQVFKKRTDDYKEKINPKPSEVRGNLSKS